MSVPTPSEKRSAETHLRSSGSKRQRVTDAAIVTEVARRRIMDGVYGKPTPNNNVVMSAGLDLKLSERQKTDLRQQLRDWLESARTLDTYFARVEKQPA